MWARRSRPRSPRTVNVALLYRTLRKRGHFVADAQLKRRAWRLALAALLMGVAMWFAQRPVRSPISTGAGIERWGAMLVLVGAGGVVYARRRPSSPAPSASRDLKALVRRRPR